MVPEGPRGRRGPLRLLDHDQLVVLRHEGHRYLFGDNPLAENVFKVIFLGFTVLGSIASLGSVIDFSDSMIFMMSIPNLIGLYLLRNVIRREFSHYRARLASGEIKEFADRH